ncbi:prostatic acid phosphatase-like [Bombyx mandarina]|uniref:acid phosphatase n=1 Tax=Bombyx mandarina TaxID=7092 RepID=A0A6J2KBP0_BOMMA|nr:prostatic acid phosphatase-like [Bombyx mandarina]
MRVVYFVVLAALAQHARAGDATDGTELVSTFLVHRHGDRTPVEITLAMSTDPAALEQAAAPYGFGQLTEFGKKTSYKVGEYIRSRYGALLSDRYNASEIFIRSTDSTRTKMTVLTAMAAVYPPPEDNWSSEIHWTPVPYTTVPPKYDHNLANLNCPEFISFYYDQFMKPSEKMAPYRDFLARWSEILGFDLVQMPALAYMFYDVYTAQLGLGVPLDEATAQKFPEIEAAAGAAIDVVFGDENYIALQAGVLLNEFLKAAAAVVGGESARRVHVYSAHDYNVYSLMAVSRISPRQGVPKYGSVFSLELRKVTATGKYVVLPVYLRSPYEQIQYLQVEGCSALLCDLEEFQQLTSRYVLEEDEWRTKCGFTHDLEVDDSSIN